MWLMALALGTGAAQAKDGARDGFGISLSTEVFTPFLGGFHAEAGVGWGKNRFSVSTTWIERPSFYTPGNAFSEYRRYLDVHYTRFILSKGQRGLNVGGGVTYFYDVDVTDTDTNEAQENSGFTRIALRLGFVWFPSKKIGLFVEPAIVAGIALGTQDIDFTDTSTYNPGLPDISGPLLLVGWRFGAPGK
ncbi:MAG: hypothetical protein AAGA48_27770 [Myxococcota bacterium]